MSRLNTEAVGPSLAFRIAELCLQNRKKPFFIHGRPGIGKSELVAQLADKHNMVLRVLMLTQIDSVDLRGIQAPDETSKRMVYFPPEFLPSPSDPPTLLFLDELTGAEPRLQVSAYQLLLSRRVGEYVLPENCYVCAAGNAPEDGAVAYEMGTALSSRLLHINMLANAKDWFIWAEKNNIHPSVLTTIKLKADLLEQTEEQLRQGVLIGPSPRSWAAVSDFVHLAGLQDRELMEPIISGLVGESAATAFFVTVNDLAGLPDPQEILTMSEKDFKKIVIKTIPGLYGMAYSLSALVDNASETLAALSFLIYAADTFTDLPGYECFTLGVEMMLRKAISKKYFNELSKDATYVRKILPKMQMLNKFSAV